jgi:3-dehydroquinate synthase
MPEILKVSLGDRSYPIMFGEDLTPQVHAIAAELQFGGKKVAVITDQNVAKIQGASLKALFGDAPVHAVAPGEASKSVAEFGRALDFLAASGLDRTGVVFAVGGGVVGDLAGFAAASYLRGIYYYQVPTTLLAMVDSSVGGKTGINLKAGKNLAGAFHQPHGVFIATGYLKTLPQREFAAGAAEVLKTALLGEPKLFSQLEKSPLTPDDPRTSQVVRRCCEVKASLVESDERENAGDGGRALLNLGHTFGHAIEQVTGYGAYLHGEAVAIGLCAAARLSRELGLIDKGDVARVESAVAAHGLPTKVREPLAISEVMAAMARDKKARAGLPRFVVLRSLGDAAVRGGVAPEAVEGAWREIGCA